MKVYISVDMEGIAGVNHPGPTGRDDLRYGEKAELMAGEANAAIEGALSAGATDVLVNDSHGFMHNLVPADLHPGATLLQGEKVWSMVAGAGPGAGFGVALFVGYHARAGDPTGTLAHTFSGRPTLTRLDGRPVGESGYNALVLGAWGTPVGLVSGDDALARETEAWLPWAERVVVKDGFGRHAAASVHPSIARDRVRAGAATAVRRAIAGELRTLVVAPPIIVEVDFADPAMADFAAAFPGAERVGDRGMRYAAADAEAAYRGYLTALRLGGATAR